MGSTGQSITLANSIIGVGILAMPFCFQQCGVLLATIILLFMGLVSRLCCYFLLKSALISRRRNFEFLAFHVFGSAGKFAVEVGIIGFLMGTCIAYFVVVGDLGPQIVAKMFNINQSDILRTSIMVIVSLVCVLPLGLLRNVDSLGNVSAATIGFYFCLVIKVVAEATSQLLGAGAVRVELWRPAGVLQCVPIFSMALFCQTQLFEIFESLPSLSLEKMNLVTKNAINICTAVYFTLGLFGYIAFSEQDISGNILMSLSPTMASDVIKLGFVMSVACSFPLIIFPCRASLYSLLYKKVHSSHHDHIVSASIPTSSFRALTVCIVCAALGVSLLLPNIELVLGLVGSTIGVLVCLVFPAAAFVCVTFKNTNERVLAKAVIILGLVIMVLGTCANLQAVEQQVDKYDEKYITKERIDQIVEDFFQKRDKSDDVMAKPDIRSQNGDSDKIDKEDKIIESVALPPNPVPPESQSNEKEHNNNKEAKKPIPNLEKLPDPVDNIVDKVSETHPKNLKRLNEANIANGRNKKINIETPKEEIKVQSNDDKINMMKQQQLIETIKQHGKEQKELIEEQKELLTEIKKTKEEIQKNKNEAAEAAEADAKKLAVESIKQIANMAIQSLAGVSDKPGQVMDERKSEQLEKLADKAVQEIAQKAVEAIKEIKENPEPAQAKVPQVPVQPDLPKPVQNIIQMHENLKQNANNPSQGAAPNNIAFDGQKVHANVDNGNQLPNVKPQINNNAQPNVPSARNVLPGQNNQQQPNINSNANPAQPVVNMPQVSNSAQPSKHIPPAENVVQPAVNVPQPAVNAPQPAVNVPQPALNVPQPAVNVPKPAVNVPQPAVNVPQPEINVVKSANNAQPVSNVQPNKIEPAANVPETNVQPVNNAQNLPDSNAAANQLVQNVANSNQQAAQNSIKHSHSPDEPQSYKQGEDTQEKTVNNIRNVPLPLAMNGNSIANQKKVNDQLETVLKEILNNNGVQEGNKAENVPARQKREVVDCAEKSTLQPEDKEICKTLMGNPGSNTGVIDLPSKVDLGSIGLPQDLPMYQNALHHISRSLKMLEETSKSER